MDIEEHIEIITNCYKNLMSKLRNNYTYPNQQFKESLCDIIEDCFIDYIYEIRGNENDNISMAYPNKRKRF